MAEAEPDQKAHPSMSSGLSASISGGIGVAKAPASSTPGITPQRAQQPHTTVHMWAPGSSRATAQRLNMQLSVSMCHTEPPASSA